MDLAREMKKMGNKKVTVIPVKDGALGTVPKDLEKRLVELEIRRRIETTQITSLLKSVRILGRAQEFETCHSNVNQKNPVKTGVKNSQEAR